MHANLIAFLKAHKLESFMSTFPNKSQIFGTTIPRINFETNPAPPLSMLFASIWGSFLAQVSALLLCQYTTTLSRGEGPDLFLQSGPEFQNLQKFFQELSSSQ